MSRNVKDLKPYSAGKLLKDFIVVELAILYITFMIGDLVIEFGNASMFLGRYLPVGLVTIISVPLLIKKYTRKCTKSEEEIVRKNILIGPIIVAVILLIYGLYSVSSNIKEIENSYSYMMGNEFTDSILEYAASEAREYWVITTFVYLIVAEAMAYNASKNINQWLKRDIVEKLEEELPNVDMTVEIEERNTEDVKNEEAIQTANNIKWDL